ncbi:DUF222 domain-containing protein [Rhodococcus hoagii]|nr:DUF222 domain-containing protein [Prescottella equi]
MIARLDPEGARERRRRATADRDARVIARDDGMAEVDGLLPAAGGRILAGRLRAMCFDVCAKDPRTDAQRRADALVALASGHTHLDCTCGRDDCATHARFPTRDDRPTRSGVSVQVLVGVDASTLLGLDDAPGYLFGHAPSTPIWRGISLRTARGNGCSPSPIAIASLASATACSTGPVVGVGSPLPPPRQAPADVAVRLRERTYRPSRQLAETVRIRDGGCRFPNCTVQASACDIDHTVAFDHDEPARGGPHYRSEPRVLVSQTPSAENSATGPSGRSAAEGWNGRVASGRPVVHRPYGPFHRYRPARDLCRNQRRTPGQSHRQCHRGGVELLTRRTRSRLPPRRPHPASTTPAPRAHPAPRQFTDDDRARNVAVRNC